MGEKNHLIGDRISWLFLIKRSHKFSQIGMYTARKFPGEVGTNFSLLEDMKLFEKLEQYWRFWLWRSNDFGCLNWTDLLCISSPNLFASEPWIRNYIKIIVSEIGNLMNFPCNLLILFKNWGNSKQREAHLCAERFLKSTKLFSVSNHVLKLSTSIVWRWEMLSIACLK